MNSYVITAVTKNDEAYLSAIFENNVLIAIIQNKKIFEKVNHEHIVKFLSFIADEIRVFPENLETFIKHNVYVLEAKNKVETNYVMKFSF